MDILYCYALYLNRVVPLQLNQPVFVLYLFRTSFKTFRKGIFFVCFME